MAAGSIAIAMAASWAAELLGTVGTAEVLGPVAMAAAGAAELRVVVFVMAAAGTAGLLVAGVMSAGLLVASVMAAYGTEEHLEWNCCVQARPTL